MAYPLKALIVCLFLLGLSTAARAETSSDLVRVSWKASNENKMDELEKYYGQIMSAYEKEAQRQAALLTSFPPRDQIESYRVMNDVATAVFIRAETLMHNGKSEEAQVLFEQAIKEYPWAQAWDPSRGAYWSIREKSQASINVIKGETAPAAPAKPKAPKTMPDLAFPGKDKIIDFEKYGKFSNEGSRNFHYSNLDQSGLSAAEGEAIYPNLRDIFKDPGYKKAVKAGRLEGSHWDFVNTEDLQAAIYKWALAPEPWGIRLFYMGIIFEKAKMYFEAIKCYQAIIVHFPGTLAWTYWQTPWYPGQAAIAKIQHIIRMHPELRLEFKGAHIRILNSYDNDPANDVTITTPGALRQLTPEEWKRYKAIAAEKVKLGKPVKKLGKGTVRLVKYATGDWQLIVKGKPWLIKGITYNPTKVGQSPDKGTLTNWMEADENHNGLIDGPDEAWVDKNRNNAQDPDEPTVGDFAIMKEMGVNTIRLYHQPMKPSKELLKRMYKKYGFMVIMGDFLGKYAIGSGATWAEGTDYANPDHQASMMQTVKDMVMEYKDEPFILMWLLGNENNYGVASNADKKPDAYYKFVNEAAKMIKSIDPNHPVAICNGDTLFLDKFARNAPEVDVYAANVYRGDYGFGAFWDQIAEAADRPVFISEYGAPGFGGDLMTYDEAQEAQAAYHRGNWLDIQYNSATYREGAGNSIGGVAFEWLDEWWKNYEPALHDTKADAVGPFPAGYYYEEWFGLFGQGDGKHSPFLREPRKIFDTYKELWNS